MLVPFWDQFGHFWDHFGIPKAIKKPQHFDFEKHQKTRPQDPPRHPRNPPPLAFSDFHVFERTADLPQTPSSIIASEMTCNCNQLKAAFRHPPIRRVRAYGIF
jgi:hypothetical protein